ncbi:MAG TPA: MarR family transcriptional regulator [Polyangiales bacterium]|nr:MarR family transcriptional regulator [Polyangiales bacterium]
MPHPDFDFADKLGRFFEKYGLPRMAGRVLGFLVTCAPAEQTFDDLVDAVSASRSSVSVATQLLLRLELIERFGVPDDRRDRYRIRDEAWTTMLEQDIASARELEQLAESGLSALKGSPRAQTTRLRAMRDFYAFLGSSLEPVLATWERQLKKR